MAECFDKNSGASVRFFKNLSGGHGKSAEPEPARPMDAHTGPFTDISCAAAVSSLSRGAKKKKQKQIYIV